MARLSPLVGKWRGSAWMAMPVWMLAGPAGPKRRFTIQVEDDRWVEAGEISHDGATWKPFFEMTLARVK